MSLDDASRALLARFGYVLDPDELWAFAPEKGHKVPVTTALRWAAADAGVALVTEVAAPVMTPDALAENAACAAICDRRVSRYRKILDGPRNGSMDEAIAMRVRSYDIQEAASIAQEIRSRRTANTSSHGASSSDLPPWELVAMHDPAGRRGVWYRETYANAADPLTPRVVEVCAGRVGEDDYVRLVAGAVLMPADLRRLAGCLRTGAMAAIDSNVQAPVPNRRQGRP